MNFTFWLVIAFITGAAFALVVVIVLAMAFDKTMYDRTQRKMELDEL